MASTAFALYHIFTLCSGAFGAPTSTWSPPFHNLTALRTESAPPWVSEPRVRGTWNLMYSCAFALGICVYTAVHVNCGTTFWRRVKWIVIALLAPEIVLYAAWVQWYAARHTARKLNELANNHSGEFTVFPATEPGEKNKPPTYTMLDGYYIVLGGLVIMINDKDNDDKYNHNDGDQNDDDNDELKKSLNDNHKKMVITPDGVIELAEKDGVFLKVPHDTIKDKSKADVLAKGLVCFQVSWLVIQAVARKVVGYPLTLLEVHTLVHVLCALTMYLLFWQKPADVHDPTLVQLDGEKSDAARERLRIKWFLSKRAYNLDTEIIPRHVYGEGTNIWMSLVAPAVLCIAYGAIHMLAWHFEFPSDIESQLWKISCIAVVAGCVSAPGLFNLSGFWSDLSEKKLRSLVNELRGETSFKAIILFSVLVAPLVVSARVGLLVLSFISLRKVPAGAYAVVPWAESIPHF